MPNQPVNWAIIQTQYGEEVVRYLQHHNVRPTKTAFGVYKIPRVSILDHCSKIAKTLPTKLATEPPKKKRKTNNSPDSTIEHNCYEIPDQVKRVVNIDAQKYRPTKDVSQLRLTNSPVEVNLLICLDPLFRRASKMPLLSFVLSKKLTTSWDYDKMFHSIMQTYIGRQKAVNYDPCLAKIKPVLQAFEKKHREFRYSTLLESIMKRKNSTSKNVPDVSILQLQQFFFTVCAKVIPRKLFGNNANIKKLRLGLREYFLSSWGEIVPLKSFVMNMDISCITWLQPIPDVETKWLIFAKLVRWLFEVYILAILKKVFRVEKDLYSEKRKILSASRWKKLRHHCLKTQERKQTLVKKRLVPNSLKNHVVPSGTTKLYPKKNGVRCIYVFRLEKSIRDEVTTLKILLQQLYRLKYDSVTMKKLYPPWLRFAKEKKKNSDLQFYLVSSDIVDAYGSVIQTKLYDILHGMISAIPGDKISREWLAILKPSKHSWRKNSVEYSQWFSGCASLPRIPAHSLVTLARDKDHRPAMISKKSICSSLKAFILQQTVWYQGTEYLLKRGLPQGFPLSSILSEIYYAHMTNEEFGIFKKSGMLSRYVDDFLYITDQKQVAKQFMKQIRKGVPEYNCRFKMSKTQTNLESRRWKSTECVEYLGHRINSATLEVAPIYGDLEFRHFKSMQCIKYKNEIQTFAIRLKNFSALKLSKIVLDTKINSVEMILATAESAAYTMASRCVVLISKVYQRCEPYASEIWEEIRSAIKMLAKIFTIHLSGYRTKQRSTLIRYIKMAIWKSIYRVFAKKTNLRRCFGDSIRRMIKNRWAF